MPEDANQNGGPTVTKNDNGGSPPESHTEPTATPVDNSDNNGSPDNGWWTEAQKRGFKSQADVWKSYSEAEKKVSEDGTQLKAYREMEEKIAPILDVLANDTEAFTLIKTKLQAKQNPGVPTPSQPDKANDGTDGASRVLQTQITDTFEKTHGIDQLDDETRKDFRKTVGKYLQRVTGGTVHLESLADDLESAFILAAAKEDNLKKLFNASGGSFDYAGAMPSIGTNNTDSGSDIQLTPEQEKAASRMPGGREAYVKGLKKMQGK